MTLVRGGPRPLRDPRLVELPSTLLERAVAVGQLRLYTAKSAGLRDSFDEDSEESHVMGACGEAAFCYAYGIHWPETVDTFKVPDVLDLEVRTTNSLDFLKVRSSDPAKRRVTFVWKRGENAWLVLTRFIRAGDAKKRYRKRDPGARNRPAWFVPVGDLLPLTDVPHTIHVWWPVAGEPGHWECFFGHEVWKLEDHGGPIYEWPHPAELVRRTKAARPPGDAPGSARAGAPAGDGGVLPDAPDADVRRGAAASPDPAPAHHPA